jgi:predicted transcriptional regulator
MTGREQLHRLVDELTESQAELARQWLADLKNATDQDDEPLSAEALASLDRGLADIKAGRVNPLEQYERLAHPPRR